MDKRVCSLFAGIGGICRAFKEYNFDIVWANELDKFACRTYKTNMEHFFNEECNYLINGDICEIIKSDLEIPDFDILCAGFPCQSFSIAGAQKGLDDDRGQLFYRVLDFIDLKSPEIIFLENVKNLVKHNKGNTFNIIKKELESRGYYIKFEVLNALNFGVPQNRERIYVVGFKNKELYDNFKFPVKGEICKNIYDLIDISDRKKEKYYYVLDNVCKKYKNEEIKDKYTSFTKEVEFENIYQFRRGMYVRKNKKGVCPTLTANMGGGGHNVPIIKDNFGIRKLTPEECFSFQGFDNFIRPEISDVYLYKQAGNSVSVPVIKAIVEKINDLL